MERKKNLIDRMVIAFDRWQRSRMGIWEFTDDPECILRMGLAKTPVGAELSDGTVIRPGDTVGVVHFWNERMPPVPLTGADLAWAREFRRLMTHSFQLVARHVVENPRLADFEALGGQLPIIFTPATTRYIERLGFEVFDRVPPRGPVEYVVDLASRLWTWLMRHAFNPGSVAGVKLSDIDRRPAWMSRRTLLRLYLKDSDTD
jgi:hypothetical protein